MRPLPQLPEGETAYYTGFFDCRTRYGVQVAYEIDYKTAM